MYGEKLIKTAGKIYGIVFCMNESFCSSFYCFNPIANIGVSSPSIIPMCKMTTRWRQL